MADVPAPRRRRHHLAVAVALLVPLVAAPRGFSQSADIPSAPQADAVRVLWTPGTVAAGRTEVEALPLAPDVRRVEFLVDGEPVGERTKPPWREKIRFAEPAKLQQLTVRAYGPNDRLLGEDSVEINRRRLPFRVLLEETTVDGVRGRVNVPRGAQLASMLVELDGQEVATGNAEAFDVPLAARTGQVVRVEATLKDGRVIEDARVLGAAGDVASIDVRLVQLQVLVTDRNGRPLQDLALDDFELRENGKKRTIDRVFPAGDVDLVLGLVVDASGSMQRIWPSVRRASELFLNTVVRERDETFLLDFADQVRLLQSPTGERARIDEALDRVSAGGITALYDSVVFGALQFGDRPGRRALVVITDGLDYGSQADPDRAVDIARKLGVPVYVVSLSGGQTPRNARAAFAQGGQVQEMKLITEPTGGRLLRTSGARGGDGLLRAFRQVADELRSQYIITYYTDRPLADLDGRDVEVRLPDRKKVDVRSVLAWDQIQ
ncbi:MAG: VWA domain-containing protein [Acidobacteriota bacterium]